MISPRSGVFAASALLALVATSVHSFDVKLTNMCDYQIVMFDSRNTENISPGDSIKRTIAPNSGAHVFRHSTNAQATLAEFSGDAGSAWFDISIIPTGPKSGPEYCPSLDECKALTGGVGFNVAMQIVPSNQNGDRCKTLTCMYDGCPDAYQYPKDDTKTHACPIATDFEVIFCPGGTGGKTPAPTPAPTPEPTPAPTPAPTPEPTPTPTPEPTPEPTPTAENENSVLSGSAGSAATGGGFLGGNSSTTDSTNEAGVSGTAGEVASDAQATTTPATDTTAAIVQTPTGTQAAVEANTQSSESSSGASTALVLIGVVAAVACVAGAAIYTVRKKKAELDAIDEKTPVDPRSTVPGNRSIMRTPQNFVDVL